MRQEEVAIALYDPKELRKLARKRVNEAFQKLKDDMPKPKTKRGKIEVVSS